MRKTRTTNVLVLAVACALAGPIAAGETSGTVTRLDLSEWVGEWVASEEQSITISLADKKNLQIEGFATYGALDPDRVERGAVNMGEFTVRVPGGWVSANNEIDIAIDMDGEAIPADEADDYDCVLNMRLDWNINWIDVTDNQMCGGLNVSFTGQYEHQPATE